MDVRVGALSPVCTKSPIVAANLSGNTNCASRALLCIWYHVFGESPRDAHKYARRHSCTCQPHAYVFVQKSSGSLYKPVSRSMLRNPAEERIGRILSRQSRETTLSFWTPIGSHVNAKRCRPEMPRSIRRMLRRLPK